MDEAHGVRDQDVLSVGQREPARGRVQGGEELVLRVDVRGGQRVEQRALPRVGVSHERDNRHRRFFPPVSVEHPVGLNLVQLLLQKLDAVAQEALVDLDLLLAHALDLPSRAAAARRAVQVRPHPRQSRELILQLRHLNLQLPLRGPRALAEYVQDEHRAVAHPNLTVQVLLDVSVLPRRELGVEDDGVHGRVLARGSRSKKPLAPTTLLLVQRAFVLVRPLVAPPLVGRIHVIKVRRVADRFVVELDVFAGGVGECVGECVRECVVVVVVRGPVREPAQPPELSQLPLAHVRARVRVFHALRQRRDDLEPRALRQLREFRERILHAVLVLALVAPLTADAHDEHALLLRDPTVHVVAHVRSLVHLARDLFLDEGLPRGLRQRVEVLVRGRRVRWGGDPPAMGREVPTRAASGRARHRHARARRYRAGPDGRRGCGPHGGGARDRVGREETRTWLRAGVELVLMSAGARTGLGTPSSRRLRNPQLRLGFV